MTHVNGEVLLRLARGAVAVRLGGPGYDAPPEARAWLEDPGATFVTIRRPDPRAPEPVLHGCIGSIAPVRPLGEDVRHNAVMAAFEDPRSRRLEPTELTPARFEVSVLGPRTPYPVASFEDLLEGLRPGADGLVVAGPGHRAVFLPQVWKQLPRPRDFVDALWKKAGLAPGAFDDSLSFERFAVDKFEEGPLSADARGGFA